MSAEKYPSGLFNYRCRLLFFLFHPWIIFGWCLLGNVRSGSSGHASFWGLDLSSFLAGRRRLAFFSINICVNHVFFCQGGLMFSWPTKWEHASVDRNITSVELERKNLADLHCKLFMQHQHTKTSSAVKKNIIGQRAFLKRNCAMSTEKYPSRYFTTDDGSWVFYSIP